MTFAFLKCWRDPYRPSGVYSKQGYIVFTTMPCFFARATRRRIRAYAIWETETLDTGCLLEHAANTRKKYIYLSVYVWREPPIARHVINGTNPTVTPTVPTRMAFDVQIVPPTAADSRCSNLRTGFCVPFVVKIPKSIVPVWRLTAADEYSEFIRKKWSTTNLLLCTYFHELPSMGNYRNHILPDVLCLSSRQL